MRISDKRDRVLDVVAERVLEDMAGSVRPCGVCGGKFTGPGRKCRRCTTERDGIGETTPDGFGDDPYEPI